LRGERRDEANNTPWNFEGHGYEVWIAQRLRIGNPVEVTVQPLQKGFISRRAESPWMNSELHCPLCLEHASIRPENAQGSLGSGGWMK